MIATQAGRAMTIYGDGKQVRDILFVDDLIRAFSARKKICRSITAVFSI